MNHGSPLFPTTYYMYDHYIQIVMEIYIYIWIYIHIYIYICVFIHKILLAVQYHTYAVLAGVP